MATRQELIEVYQKRGQAPKALALFAGTRRWLDEHASFRDSEEGQYEFAKLLGSMASTGSRFSSDRRRRPGSGPTPFPLANRPNPGAAETLPPILLARFQREMELCNQALELLQGLRASHPDVAMYRLTMSRTYRERARVHRQLNEIDAADRDLEMAIELLQQLADEPSHSLLLKFELAETLGTPIAERDIDAKRAETALKLCDEVLAKDPQAPEALALRASLLARLAWTMPMPMGPSRGEWALKGLNQAIDIQRQLVDRYPNVPVYAMALLQTYVQRAETLAFLRRFDKALESLDEAESMSQQLATARIAPALINATVERLHERRRNLEARKEGKTVSK
jgi:tetratricopeptide (TPR) repeat protein